MSSEDTTELISPLPSHLPLSPSPFRLSNTPNARDSSSLSLPPLHTRTHPHMYSACKLLRELQSGINVGRAKLAQQFATMDGWQAQQDSRFDAYVKAKRQQEYYDAFDQRVERAYRSAAKLHRAEVINRFKRALTANHEKFSAQTVLEMKAAVTERLRWLREVWSQVDADYRSQDPKREAAAAKEISAALQGEPGDYMKWVYEAKREERFLGEKAKAAFAAELEGAELPEVSEEEVNRYHSLALDMMEVEREVKLKYGIAGQQHWAELQRAKDEVYEEKLDRAAQTYKELLRQSDSNEESRRTALLRNTVERVHQAQVRFKAAMELESERERLVEAHRAMEEERRQAEKEQRVALLKEAAELRQQGATGEEVQAALRERQLAAHARRQAEDQLKEQEYIVAKKAKYLRLIEKFKAEVDEREGRELMGGGDSGSSTAALSGDGDGRRLQPQRNPAESPRTNVFGFLEEDRLDGGGGDHSLSSSPAAAAPTAAETHGEPRPSGQSASPHANSKRSLWRDIAADKYEDPFHTIHQARLDAERAYDPAYAKFFPKSTIQGRKYSRQGMGEFAAGNAMDNQVLQQANMNVEPYSWGTKPFTVFDLDGDGNTDYFYNGSWHVQDKETGDIDFRYEKKKGGPIFRGPRLYSRGAAREAKDPGERPMDPTPFNANVPWNLRAPAVPSGHGQQPPPSVPRGGGSPPRRTVRLNRVPPSSPAPQTTSPTQPPHSLSPPSTTIHWRSG